MHVGFRTVYEIRIKMCILLCKLFFKLKVILGTFPLAIEYTFTAWYCTGSTLWMHHNIFNWFPVIGHLFSSTLLSTTNNVVIDNLEINLVKQFFNTILFYMYGKSYPKYPHFVMFLLCVLWFFTVFIISEILHHDDEMFIHLGYCWNLIELFKFCIIVNTFSACCIFQRWLNLCILFPSIYLH